MGSSVDIDNKGNDILMLGEGSMQGLNDTTLTAEAICTINFTQPNKRFVLSLHYKGSNSFLFVNATKKYYFNTKDSEIKDHVLCLGNNSKEFTINNLKNNRIKIFSVHFNPIDTNNNIDIHKYLMKGKRHKIMFRLIKKIFIRLLSGIISASNHTKCV